MSCVLYLLQTSECQRVAKCRGSVQCAKERRYQLCETVSTEERGLVDKV